MAKFLLDHTVVPPGGNFYYVQPESGARIEAPNVNDWFTAIEKHRTANGYELEPLWRLHIEEWLCHDLKTRGIDWCRIQGTGDIVAYGLRPLVHAADQYLGTNLANCKGCSGRQHFLNKL